MSVCAIVVGIERYDGPWPPLDGPGPDAYRVAAWLRRQGVPPEDIYLHVSPLVGSAAGLPAVDVPARPATREAIFHGTLREVQSRRGDELLVFWGGHGAADGEERRYLFYQDASAGWETHLNLNGFLQGLRTERYGFTRQLVVVDACGNFLEEMGMDAGLPGDAPPRSRTPGAAERQSVLYASLEGRPAENDDWGRGGMLTGEVLRALEEDPHFPPRAERIWPRVKARFDEMRAAGQAAQVPAVYDVVIDGAARERFVSSRGGAAPRGVNAAILYDRTAPAERFQGLVHRQLAGPPSTRAYLVLGEEHERHRTFARRVRETSLQERADLCHGPARGHVGELGPVGWPAGDAYAPVLEDTLRAQLGEAASSPGHPRDGAELLRRWQPGARHAVVLVTHLVQVEGWSAAQHRLLCWYLDEFWSEAKRTPEMPHVVLLVLVECSERMAARSLADRLTGRRCEKERLERALGDVAGGAAAIPPPLPWLPRLPPWRASRGTPRGARSCDVLPELRPMDVGDVVDWFHRFRETLRLSPADCEPQAKKVFAKARARRDGIRRTDHIEDALLEAVARAESTPARSDR